MPQAVIETTRKLASVVTVTAVMKHPNADKLSLATVGGWQCITKLDEFKAGDLAIYCEIDSLLPIDLPEFSFLETRTSDNKVFNNKMYHRLKSIKMRGELSQGLLVPLPSKYSDYKVGDNLTTELGILKYEADSSTGTELETLPEDSTLITRLVHWLKGDLEFKLLPWRSEFTKSEEDRIQNKYTAFVLSRDMREPFEVSYKLDGASMTVGVVKKSDGTLFSAINSRNGGIPLEIPKLNWKEQTRYWLGRFIQTNRRWYKRLSISFPLWKTSPVGFDNQYLKYCTEHNLLDRLTQYYLKTDRDITLQGELIGPGIQSNFENVPELQFYVYKVFVNGNRQLLPNNAKHIAEELGLNYIPVLHAEYVIPADATIKDILSLADGPSALNGKYREGVVLKSLTRFHSWKIISNQYLLKQKD
jgi:hypothetical protein